MSTFGRPNHAATNHNIGYITSVDAAKRQTYSTTSLAGVKRNFNAANSSDLEIVKANSYLDKVSTTVSILPPNRLQVSKITKLDVKATCDNHTIIDSKISSTPGVTQQPELSLAHKCYELPPQLVTNFQCLGVRAIYPWQSKCLLNSGILRTPRNLIYTAPTGGGKSLVADIVLLKNIIEKSSKKAIVVLPYVALVQEKTKWLRRLVEGVEKIPDHQNGPTSDPKRIGKDIRVAAFFGGSKGKLTWADCDIAVCTIEKANSIINTAIEESHIDDLGTIILDELHMVDDPQRGYVMELMMAKLLLAQIEVQIIGMSATLSNPELLARWLQAKFFVASYRPIPIEEHLVYDNAIYPTANAKDFFRTASHLASQDPTQRPLRPSYIVEKSQHKELDSPTLNSVIALAVETAVGGFGSLVFCSSRLGTQNVATLIAESIPPGSDWEVVNKRMEVLASLQALPGGFESTLTKTIPSGVAFHHAGMTTEERNIIAEAYDGGILKVMAATCSLAAGVNLPARRVILSGARMGRELVGPAMLRQMRGRAGRKGKDEIGQTYLCCQKSDLEAVAELLEAKVPPVVSCLTPEKRGLKRAILEVIATRLANSHDTLRDYVTCSLLWHTGDRKVVLEMLDSALKSLLNDKLIELTTHSAYVATPLGSAIVASGLTPEDGIFVHADLRRALSSFVMDSELHLFYLFTPIPQSSSTTLVTGDISFPTFRNLIDTLDEPSLYALQRIGVNPGLVNHLANSGVENLPENTTEEVSIARIYRRAYSTFALRDLCNEVPIHQISLKYDLPRGTIQNLAQTCHGFAAGMIKFCQRMAESPSLTRNGAAFLPSTYNSPPTDLYSHTADPQASGFSMLAAVLEHMQSRLYAGARSDLLEMTQVSFVKGRMARLLYESGFKSVRALAEADPKKDILPIMWSAFGWKLNQKIPFADIGDQEHEPSQIETEIDRRKRLENLHEMRHQKLEEKLLQKAEVMVASASRIHEREVLRTAADLED